MKIYIPEHEQPFTKPEKNPIQVILEQILPTENVSAKNQYEISRDPSKADYFLLPYTWNFYIDNHLTDFAVNIYKEAKQAGKRLILFSTGDFTANTTLWNTVEIQSSGFKSRDGVYGKKLLGIPTFIDDYLSTYCKGNLQIREKKPQPTVGFCGQANGSVIDYIRRHVHIYFKQFRYKIGILKWEPPNIEPTLFRNKILRQVQKTSGISSNMILRTKYRAGYRPKIKDPFHPTRLEFIHNILNSDYTICLRGGGNFSVRFYETLALGRIPIFINTDCILPLDEIIDYKEYMVWVEQDEIQHIGEKIIDFHNSLTNNQFIALQKECRYLWLNYLTINGYIKSLPQILRNLQQCEVDS